MICRLVVGWGGGGGHSREGRVSGVYPGTVPDAGDGMDGFSPASFYQVVHKAVVIGAECS